jgi:tryptophan aminotransferase
VPLLLLIVGPGKPNPETFPFSKISVTLNGPEEETLVLDEAALAEALQYGLPAGHSGLIKVCRMVVKSVCQV